MNATLSRVLMSALIVLTAGCGNDISASAGFAASSTPAPEADAQAPASIPAAEAPLLGDERVRDGPDDSERFDEESAGGIDILAEDAGDVKFTPVATTSLRVTAEDMRYVQLLEQRGADAPPADSLTANAPAETAEVPQAPQDTAAVDATATSASAPAPASMDEKEILQDKNGQWAVSATASSTYAQSSGDKAPYSAWHATGAPNVPRYSDDGAAWASKSGDSKDPEWLEVTFARPVHATAIRVRQNTAPGAISRIDLIDENGQSHPLWAGTDNTVYARNTIGWLTRDLPRTAFKVRAARITLMTARVWGWNEIDAVQLVGEP
jgi:hypothetical protein